MPSITDDASINDTTDMNVINAVKNAPINANVDTLGYVYIFFLFLLCFFFIKPCLYAYFRHINSASTLANKQ